MMIWSISSRAASIAMTLVWALSGAWQWMRGLGQRDEARRALMIAGYAWMGIASFKLVPVSLVPLGKEIVPVGQVRDDRIGVPQ